MWKNNLVFQIENSELLWIVKIFEQKCFVQIYAVCKKIHELVVVFSV